MKLLLNCDCLKSCLFRYKNNNVNDPYCDLCNGRNVENVEHVMFRCSENANSRHELWLSIKQA